MSRILVALDVPTAEEAVRLARSLSDDVGGFKVGLRLLHGAGPAVIGALARLEKPVFADAKLHDIPSQVEAAARWLGRHGSRWVTAHASGGRAMLEAAVAGLRAGRQGSGILAVTVLTSLDDAAVAATGLGNSAGKLTSTLARTAADAGVEGVVCAVKQLGVIAGVAPGLVKVTPGIRPGGITGDDQRSVATPSEAIERGADWLVIGRPITEAPDPIAAVRALNEGLS